MSTRACILLCLCIAPLALPEVYAQVQAGMLPSVNANVKLDKLWAINTRIESRILKEESGTPLQYNLTDFAIFTSRKIASRTTLAAGYLFRALPDEAAAHRASQQVSFIRPRPAFTLGHRIATDQTWQDGEPPVWRLRYRIGAEVPLQGQTVDPKEFFIRLSNEYLQVFESDTYDLEVRVVAVAGFVPAKSQKVELGADYRVDSFLAGPAEHVVWMALSYFVSF